MTIRKGLLYHSYLVRLLFNFLPTCFVFLGGESMDGCGCTVAACSYINYYV